VLRELGVFGFQKRDESTADPVSEKALVAIGLVHPVAQTEESKVFEHFLSRQAKDRPNHFQLGCLLPSSEL